MKQRRWRRTVLAWAVLASSRNLLGSAGIPSIQ